MHPIRLLPLLLCCLSLLPFTAPAAGAGSESSGWIVKDGEPQAEIVIAAEPARMARLAATELQAYVEAISGAVLPIVNKPSGERVRIYVGVSPDTEELGLETAGLKHGAYRVASGENWLALLGPDKDYDPPEPWGRQRGRASVAEVDAKWEAITGEPFASPYGWHYMHYYPDQDVWTFDNMGTLNAVYTFLYDLGVRWYAPGDIGEVLPERESIPLLNENTVVEPDFALRNLTYFYGQHGLGEVGAWNLRLGFNPGGDIQGHVQQGHGIKWVVLRPEMREANPEYYALYDGERDHIAPCLSSPGLFDSHVNYVRSMMDHYGEQVVNIDMPDGYGRGICQCELCEGLDTPERGRDGSMSDYVWGYLNRVAEAIYESHPDRMVSALAYSTYRQPPTTIDRMSPNLTITDCRTRSLLYDEERREYTRQIREQWLEILPSQQYYIWDYYLNARPGERGLPVYFPTLIVDELRELKGKSMGDLIEVFKDQDFIDYRPREPLHDYDPFAVNHFNVYLTSRLWWDADQDVDALLDEYYRLYYGPAATEMQDFIEYSDANWPRMRRNREAITGALERLEAAQAAVDPESIYGQRIARVANYAEPLYSLREQLARVREDVPSARVLPAAALHGKKLDGSLEDDKYWPKVRMLPLRAVTDGGSFPRELFSWVRIFRAGDALYFGIYCSEPDMAGLPNADDYVEVLLETSSGASYRIRVTPDGTIEDADLTDGEEVLNWDARATAAVLHGDDFWSVELRVPLAGAGIRGIEPWAGVDGRMPSALYPWYFNVGRQRVRNGEAQRATFAPTGSDAFHVPERYAEMWSK